MRTERWPNSGRPLAQRSGALQVQFRPRTYRPALHPRSALRRSIVWPRRVSLARVCVLLSAIGGGVTLGFGQLPIKLRAELADCYFRGRKPDLAQRGKMRFDIQPDAAVVPACGPRRLPGAAANQAVLLQEARFAFRPFLPGAWPDLARERGSARSRSLLGPGVPEESPRTTSWLS